MSVYFTSNCFVCVCVSRTNHLAINNKTTPTPVRLFALSLWHELCCIKCRLFFLLLFSVFDKLYECLKCGRGNFKNELHEDSDLWLLKYILFSVPVIVFVHTIILFFLNSVSQLHAAYNVMVPFLIYDKNKRRVTFIFVFCVLFLNECVL